MVTKCADRSGSTSRVAAEVAKKLYENNTFDCIFWIDATSITSFMRGMECIAVKLELPLPADATSHANAAKLWMETRSSGSWLTILDASDLEAVSGSHELDVDAKEKHFVHKLPQRSSSPLRTILVTTSRRNVAQIWSRHPELAFEVPFLKPDEAANLLRIMSGDRRAKEQDVVSLAKELDENPSAILAASALILHHSEAGETIAKFLARSRKDKDKFIAFFNGSHKSTRDLHMTSLTVTWVKAIEAVQKQSRKSCDLLFLIACLDGTSISERLFCHAFGWKEPIELEFETIISKLLDYRLISRDSTTKCYRMPRLVRLTTRHWMKTHARPVNGGSLLLKWHLKALDSLLIEYDNMEPETGHSMIAAQLRRRTLLPHAAMFQQFCRAGGRCRARLSETQFEAIVRFSDLFSSEGHYKTASDMLGFARESPVPQSEWRRVAMLRLAVNLRNQTLVDGDSHRLEQAFAIVREVKETAGDTAPNELWSTLALLLVDKGKFDDAAYYQWKVVLALSQEHGNNSVSVLDARLELSKIRCYQDNVEKALQEQEEIEHLLQTEPLCADPDTNSRVLQVQAALVKTYYTIDRLDLAVEVVRKVVEGRTKLYGELDMKTIGSEKDLAQCLFDEGQTADAIAVLENVKSKLEQKFDFDHEEVRGCGARLEDMRVQSLHQAGECQELSQECN
jgi:tetratricopeptide (TPR) repeat protein